MEYKEIKVYLHTNLEELDEDKRTILFESSKLIHPEVKSRRGLKKYPSVSFRVRQNYTALSELNFYQKMQFFFNTGSHISLLRIFPGLFDKETNKHSANSTEFFKEYNEIIKDNIMSMLQLLFVGSPLNAINVTSSWDYVVDKFTLPSLPSIYGFFRGISHNSLLDVNGKQYSFDRLVWMNDVLNCPVYSELFIKYREFIRWRNNEIQKLEASGVVNKDEVPDITKIIDALETTSTDYENFILKFRETPRTEPKLPHPPTTPQVYSYYSEINDTIVGPLYYLRFLISYLKSYIDKGESLVRLEIDGLHDEVETYLNNSVLKNDNGKYNYNHSIPRYRLNSAEFPVENMELPEVFKKMLGYKDAKTPLDSSVFSIPQQSVLANKTTWKVKFIPNEYNRLQSDLDKVKKAIDVFFNSLTTGNKASDTIRKRIEILNDLLTKSYEHIREEYREKAGRDRDAQYSYFIEQYIRSRLSYANKSTNTILQNLINLQTDKETKRFFEFLNRAFEYFYEGKGKSFKAGEEDADLLYSGVNSKYEGNNLAPIYEIHVLCDLYFGPSGKLYGKQNCNQKGQELGKNLELVLTQNVDTLEKNRQKWDLNYRRIMYSPSDSGVTDEQGQGQGKGMGQGQGQGRGQGQGQGQGQGKVQSANINTNLFQEMLEDADKAKQKQPNPPPNPDITHWEPKNSVSFMDAINGYYNQYSELRDGKNFTKESALFIIKESKDPDERILYDMFVDFNKQLFQFSQKLLDKLVRQSGIYKSTIQQAQSQQDEYIRVHPTRFNDVGYVKLSLKCEKNYFFQLIAEEMMKRENKKPKLNMLTGQSQSRAAGGGAKIKKTRRARLSKKRFTRRNNYSRLH